jgi:hypothetical protein
MLSAAAALSLGAADPAGAAAATAIPVSAGAARPGHRHPGLAARIHLPFKKNQLFRSKTIYPDSHHIGREAQ